MWRKFARQNFLGSANSSLKYLTLKRNMRLIQFIADGKRSVGVEVEKDGAVVDVCKFDSTVPDNMREFLEGGPKMLDIAKRYIGDNFYFLDSKNKFLS